MTPHITPIKYSVIVIVIFSFKFLFDLYRIRIPTPDPTSRPAIIVPKLIRFDKYNSVIITELAQFGIRPIKQEIATPKIGRSKIRLATVSSPIKNINVLIANVLQTI